MREIKIKTAVLISGGGTNLQALIRARDQGRLPDAELALVVSNRSDAYGLVRAKRAGIPTAVLTKKSCGGQAGLEKSLLGLLEEQGIELIVLAGFLSILSADFTRRYPRRILNIHPSLIPSFCGAGFYGLKVHEAVLEKGVKVTGATVHFVNEIPDGGQILLQKAVKVQEGDTPEVLQKRVMRQAEWKLLPQAVAIVSKEMREKENGYL